MDRTKRERRRSRRTSWRLGEGIRRGREENTMTEIGDKVEEKKNEVSKRLKKRASRNTGGGKRGRERRPAAAIVLEL